MKSEEFSKHILSLDPAIRFAGLIERSVYLFAGGMREGTNTQLNAVAVDMPNYHDKIEWLKINGSNLL